MSRSDVDDDAELSAMCAEMRSELEQMRPQLLVLRELYSTYIDAIHTVLFCAAPPLPSGGFRNLPPAIEKECEEAVVRVLKGKLAKVTKALGSLD